jgi:hypothetical protein
MAPQAVFSAAAPTKGPALRAFSSEVDTGSREENASKQESRASVLIQSEPKLPPLAENVALFHDLGADLANRGVLIAGAAAAAHRAD